MPVVGDGEADDTVVPVVGDGETDDTVVPVVGAVLGVVSLALETIIVTFLTVGSSSTSSSWRTICSTVPLSASVTLAVVTRICRLGFPFMSES